MPTIKGFNLRRDEEGKATMTDGEGNPVNISPFRSATPEEQVEEKPEEKSEEESKLLKLTRSELNDMAEEKGLDPDDYHNKEEVAKAILADEEEDTTQGTLE